MDLYGDLPPAVNESEQAQPSGRGASSWTATGSNSINKVVAAVLRPRQLTVPTSVAITQPNFNTTAAVCSDRGRGDSGPAAIDIGIRSKNTTVPTKGIPSNAFKPRQAKVVREPIPTISSAKYDGNSVNVAADENLSNRRDISVDTSSRKHKRRSMRGEYNSNTGFDVEGEPYDPQCPNDYIAYCEERLHKKRQLRLLEENRTLLQKQEQQRHRLENERMAAAAAGDYQKLIQLSNVRAGILNNSLSGLSRQPDSINSSNTSAQRVDAVDDFKNAARGTGAGRGRGGVVNLPAWMTQQMSAAASEAEISPMDSAVRFQDSSSSGREDGMATIVQKPTLLFKPSCIILLKNMVSSAEAEEEIHLRDKIAQGSNEVGLAVETSQECSKYGTVLDCVLHMLPLSLPFEESGATVPNQQEHILVPEEDRVRLFVRFERQESAVKAYREMNGRYFAGRRITAQFFDETRFLQKQFDLNSGEIAALSQR